MSEEDNKILKYNQGEKSFIIYANLEPLLEKINNCHNNCERSSTTKINKHTPSGYSLFTPCLFDTTKNKPDYCRGKDCMKNFCLGLREHATEIINYEKRERIPLTKEEKKIHCRQKKCYICKKRFSTNNNNMLSKINRSNLLRTYCEPATTKHSNLTQYYQSNALICY